MFKKASTQATTVAAAELPCDCWLVYCDGSAYPNPGRMGCGAVLIAPSGSHYQHSKATAFSGCNNEAELRAVGMAAGALLTLGAKTAIFFTDNLFVLEHMQPSTTKRAVHKLARLADEIKVLMEPLQNVQWQWIPRHRNTEADTLARAALGLPPKIKPPSGRKIKRRS